MAENLVGPADVCGICLENSEDPLNLPYGHSFCDGCLNEWRSRHGVMEEMRRKCPICRATLPPSKEMAEKLLTLRAEKQELEADNNTYSSEYERICFFLEEAERKIGADWDGVTVLQDKNDEPAVAMPDYIDKATRRGDCS